MRPNKLTHSWLIKVERAMRWEKTAIYGGERNEKRQDVLINFAKLLYTAVYPTERYTYMKKTRKRPSKFQDKSLMVLCKSNI